MKGTAVCCAFWRNGGSQVTRRIPGFSIIEMLIVVAIIAILTAVAVPNYINAKLRSEISRVKADLRTMAVAVESYSTDYGKPPPHSAGLAGTPFDYLYAFGAGGGTATLTYAITTPVAYLPTFMMEDPFVQGDPTIGIDERVYTYVAYQWKWPEYVTSAGFSSRADAVADGGSERWTGIQWKAVYGKWKVLSVGPDRNYYNSVPTSNGPWVAIPYDPTNGLTSLGNIVRSEKEPDQTTFVAP
jgi:prepilin-type N-terminal cleavage/methylation domain-containing protein